MKKYFSIFVFILSIIIMTGCCNVSFTRAVYDDGRIRDEYTIQIDSDAPDSTQIFNRFVSDVEDEIDAENTLYRDSVIARFAQDSDLRDYYLNGFTTLIRRNLDTRIKSISITRDFLNDDILSVYIQAMNGTLLPSEDEEENPDQNDVSEDSGYVLEDGFFVQRYATYSKNWFYTFFNDNKEIFEDYMSGTIYNLDNFNDFMNITQTYIAPTSKMHTNADLVEKDDTIGYTAYTWNLTDSWDNGEGRDLKFYYNIPHATNYYILSAAIAVGVAVVLCIVGFVFHKKSLNKLDDVDTETKN